MTPLRVFISYRRSDSSSASRSIYASLCGTFGAENVFLDVDSIPPGVDFRQHIRSTIEA